MQLEQFRKHIWDFYHNYGRSFTWRNVTDPYLVFVSEIMLQQTQTSRVAEKFPLFIAQFPTFQSLASAGLSEVLQAWQGLGYNRRARFLHESAKIITTQHQNKLPEQPEILKTLPGIGPGTVGSLGAFVFNRPTVFIETNIRTVFIATFFANQENIRDDQLLPLIAKTVDLKNPREWYYALMDYGVFLKKTLKNPSKKSAHHTLQSRFEGSDRQVRGNIIRILLCGPQAKLALQELNPSCTPERLDSILHGLVRDQLIYFQSELIFIKP